MYQTSHFAAAYRPRISQSKSISAPKLCPQKRKRDRDSSGQDSAGSEATEALPIHTHLEPDRGTGSNIDDRSISSSELEELEIPGMDLPQAYSSRDSATKLLGKEQLTKELAGLRLDSNTQLGRVGDSSLSQKSTLRQQHATNVITILHRCLLHGDYIRASRAWGILLRVEQKRDPHFLRSNGRWGIGAEILLRQNGKVTEDTDRKSSVDATSEADDQVMSDQPLFQAALSENGFEKVRTYFDTLSVLFPRRKRAPNAMDELVFKHTMFTLWVHFVREHAAAIEKAKEGHQSRSESAVDSKDGRLSDGNYARERLQHSQAYLLKQAERIFAELDELVMKAEFANDKMLCDLRDMVKNWIDDLSFSNVPPSSQESEDS